MKMPNDLSLDLQPPSLSVLPSLSPGALLSGESSRKSGVGSGEALSSARFGSEFGFGSGGDKNDNNKHSEQNNGKNKEASEKKGHQAQTYISSFNSGNNLNPRPSGGLAHLCESSQQHLDFPTSLTAQAGGGGDTNNLLSELAAGRGYNAVASDSDALDKFNYLVHRSVVVRGASALAERTTKRKLVASLGSEIWEGDESNLAMGIDLIKQRRLLVPRERHQAAAAAGSQAQNVLAAEQAACWGDGAIICSRIDALKVELLKRSNQAAEAERMRQAQKQAERQRKEQVEVERRRREEEKARSAQQQKVEKERQAAAAAATAISSIASVPAAQPAHGSAEPGYVGTTTADGVALAMKRRRRFAAREKQVTELSDNKQMKKIINGCRMMIQQMGETARALKLGYWGTQRNFGPGKFLAEIQQRKPDSLEPAFHIVADTVLKVGTDNVAPDRIKNGETKFALVYLVVVLSINFTGFHEVFNEALNTKCPYSVPGLREEIATELSKCGASVDRQRAAIGYISGESSADYIARMQAFVGFQAGVLQTSVRLVQQFDLGVQQGATHPCPGRAGGIIAAWRWLAQMANAPPSRWTPYLIQAFVVVCGAELSRQCGSQMKKLAVLLGSHRYLDSCKAVGDFDQTKSDNDIDRFDIFKNYWAKVNGKLGGVIPPPGREDKDARSLVLDVENLGA